MTATVTSLTEQIRSITDMERDSDEEEEYVLLDLDDVSEHLDIPLNAPYVLSGLDTLKPMLTIGDNLKLVGEYEETIGTCIVFTEDESKLVVHEETGKCITDSNQVPKKQVKSIAGLQKILKFRLSPDVDIPYSIAKPTSLASQNQNVRDQELVVHDSGPNHSPPHVAAQKPLLAYSRRVKQ